eukprot:scaffold1941_cov263-Pinguiococcus_pyrenoidosus.AAC.23
MTEDKAQAREEQPETPEKQEEATQAATSFDADKVMDMSAHGHEIVFVQFPYAAFESGDPTDWLSTPLFSYEEEATPLRGYIRQARELLQGHVSEAKGQVETQIGDLTTRAQEMTPTVNFAWDGKCVSAADKAHAVDFVSRSTHCRLRRLLDMAKFNEFRRKHPEVLITGATAAVFLPSTILGSRWGMFSRTVKTAALASVVVYGVNEIERRMANRANK